MLRMRGFCGYVNLSWFGFNDNLVNQHKHGTVDRSSGTLRLWQRPRDADSKTPARFHQFNKLT